MRVASECVGAAPGRAVAAVTEAEGGGGGGGGVGGFEGGEDGKESGVWHLARLVTSGGKQQRRQR